MKMELRYCPKCIQMTNHRVIVLSHKNTVEVKIYEYLKCEANSRKEA